LQSLVYQACVLILIHYLGIFLQKYSVRRQHWVLAIQMPVLSIDSEFWASVLFAIWFFSGDLQLFRTKIVLK